MTPALTPDEREEFEERAAILQYDALLSRAEAERRAMEMVLRKRPMRQSALELGPRERNRR